MKIIDCFYTDEPVIDRWTFVTDQQEPDGMYDMIATNDVPEDSWRGFSQFTSGNYDPNGDNSHLGTRRSFTPEDIGEVLMRHVLGRIKDDPYEDA